MTSLEKCKFLMKLDKKKSLVKITSVRGEVYFCRLTGFAEDEEDWAYHIVTLESPPRHFILECNYIESIEEIKNFTQAENVEAVSA